MAICQLQLTAINQPLKYEVAGVERDGVARMGRNTIRYNLK